MIPTFDFKAIADTVSLVQITSSICKLPVASEPVANEPAVSEPVANCNNPLKTRPKPWTQAGTHPWVPR